MTTQDNETKTPVVDEDAVNLAGMARAAGGRKKTNFLPKMKDNIPTIGRILPAFGKNHGGVPFAVWFVHWWRKPGDKKGTQVACSLKSDKAGCPICDEVKILYKTLDDMTAKFTSGDGKNRKTDWKAMPKDILVQAEELKERIQSIKAERKYYYNMMTPDGTVGVWPVSMTLGEKINDTIRDCIQKKSFNPTSRKEGCFFSMVRKKDPSDKYQFNVELYTKPVKKDGKLTLELDSGPLPEAVLQNFDSLMTDVHDLYKVRTAAEIKKVMLEEPSSDVEEDVEEPVSASSSSQGATPDEVDAMAKELGLSDE